MRPWQARPEGAVFNAAPAWAGTSGAGTHTAATRQAVVSLPFLNLTTDVRSTGIFPDSNPHRHDHIAIVVGIVIGGTELAGALLILQLQPDLGGITQGA